MLDSLLEVYLKTDKPNRVKPIRIAYTVIPKEFTLIEFMGCIGKQAAPKSAS